MAVTRVGVVTMAMVRSVVTAAVAVAVAAAWVVAGEVAATAQEWGLMPTERVEVWAGMSLVAVQVLAADVAAALEHCSAGPPPPGPGSS